MTTVSYSRNFAVVPLLHRQPTYMRTTSVLMSQFGLAWLSPDDN